MSMYIAFVCVALIIVAAAVFLSLFYGEIKSRKVIAAKGGEARPSVEMLGGVGDPRRAGTDYQASSRTLRHDETH